MVQLLFLGSSVQLPHAFRWGDDIGEPDAELFVDHHYFALCDQAAVYQNVHRFAGQAIELQHGSLRELQQVLDCNLGTSEFDGKLNRNIQNHVDVVARLEADLSSWATAFVGYRHLELDLDDEDDAELDKAFEIGVRLGF